MGHQHYQHHHLSTPLRLGMFLIHLVDQAFLVTKSHAVSQS